MIDWQKMMDEFSQPTGGSSNIESVYHIMPTLNQEQIQIIASLTYYANVHDLEDIKAYIKQYMKLQSSNKNLSFFEKQSANKLLQSYTNEELMRGFKPQIQHVEERK